MWVWFPVVAQEVGKNPWRAIYEANIDKSAQVRKKIKKMTNMLKFQKHLLKLKWPKRPIIFSPTLRDETRIKRQYSQPEGSVPVVSCIQCQQRMRTGGHGGSWTGLNVGAGQCQVVSPQPRHHRPPGLGHRQTRWELPTPSNSCVTWPTYVGRSVWLWTKPNGGGNTFKALSHN